MACFTCERKKEKVAGGEELYYLLIEIIYTAHMANMLIEIFSSV